MTDSDLGIDFAMTTFGGSLDIDGTLTTVSGRTALIQDLARRLTTKPGSLFWAPSEGLDLRDWLDEAMTDAQRFRLRGRVQAEIKRDERVAACQASVTFDATTKTIRVRCEVSDAEGPFTFVLEVSKVTVALLKGE